ncbi:hypothetical protein GUF76_22795 [Xanthomonas citri pv. citri]|nr:hypothetical protein [Xanthomonas citri pv. citri]
MAEIERAAAYNRGTVTWLRNFLSEADSRIGGMARIVADAMRLPGIVDDVHTAVLRDAMIEIGRSRKGRLVRGVGSIFPACTCHPLMTRP